MTAFAWSGCSRPDPVVSEDGREHLIFTGTITGAEMRSVAHAIVPTMVAEVDVDRLIMGSAPGHIQILVQNVVFERNGRLLRSKGPPGIPLLYPGDTILAIGNTPEPTDAFDKDGYGDSYLLSYARIVGEGGLLFVTDQDLKSLHGEPQGVTYPHAFVEYGPRRLLAVGDSLDTAAERLKASMEAHIHDGVYYDQSSDLPN